MGGTFMSMATKTYTTTERAGATRGDYVKALNAKGVLAEFEAVTDHVDAGGSIETEDVNDFVARARAAIK